MRRGGGGCDGLSGRDADWRRSIIADGTAVTILVLSGGAERAIELARERFPGADVRLVAKDELASHGGFGKVSYLRRLRCDAFLVFFQDISTQLELGFMKTLALLPVARERMLIDAAGRSVHASRASFLFRDMWLIGLGVLWFPVLALVSAAGLTILRLTPRKVGAGEPPGTRAVLYLRTDVGSFAGVGGSATHASEFVRALTQLDRTVSIFSSEELPWPKSERVSARLVRPKTWPHCFREVAQIAYNRRVVREALRDTSTRGADIVYQRHARLSCAGAWVATRLRRPFVLEYNGSEAWTARHWNRGRLPRLIEMFENMSLARADLVAVVAEAERQNLLERGVPEEKILVNPNGVDPERFSVDDDVATARRRQLGWEDKIIVGFVGTFGPWHGATVLAEAVPGCLASDANLRFLFVGDGAQRESVERSLAAQQSEGSVIFTGSVSPDQVPIYLAACDILSSPHVRREDGGEFFGSPTKLFEYMAAGGAIVASDIGQLAEILTDGETGLLVPQRDPAALVAAIVTLSGDPSRRRRLGEGAKRLAAEKYTWKDNARRLLDAVERVGSTRADGVAK